MPRRLSRPLIAAVILTLIAIYFALAGKTRGVESASVTISDMEIGQQAARAPDERRGRLIFWDYGWKK